MKTLDEVIRANECCDHGEPDSRCEDCPYNGIGACCLERESDALRYLKEYKERKETLRYWSEKAISEQQNFVDAYMFCKSENEKDNNPLTWEELESMEGKPVWVEYEGYAPDWEIIENVGTLKWADGLFVETNTSILHKEDQGKTWQAYRRVRE